MSEFPQAPLSGSENLEDRRRLLIATTGACVVAAGAVAVPFVATLTPSDRARAAGAPVEIDVSGLNPGDITTVEWRGKPVWVLRRTPAMLDALETLDDRLVDPASEQPQQPDYAIGRHRSVDPEFLVVIGICTHLGCSPTEKIASGAVGGMGADWPGGFFCPCHGSHFDLAGRVFRNQPAPTNLEVPPHKWLDAARIVIGVDESA